MKDLARAREGLRTVADAGTWLLLGLAYTHHGAEVHGTAGLVVLVVCCVLTVLSLLTAVRLTYYRRRLAAALRDRTGIGDDDPATWQQDQL